MKLQTVSPEDQARGATMPKDRRGVQEGMEGPADMREVAATQRAFADYIDRSPRISAQRRAVEGIQAGAAVASAPNRTGLPDQLKAGIEHLSGIVMDDVTVHYNSSAPAQLQAHAYAQGNAIHVGPGQEHHLPHEAWHVAQQKQGRVQSNAMAGGVAINDDPALEREADIMGARAVRSPAGPPPRARGAAGIVGQSVQRVADKALLKALKKKGIDKKDAEAFQQKTSLADAAILALVNADLYGEAKSFDSTAVARIGDDPVEKMKVMLHNRAENARRAAAPPPARTVVDELEEAGLARLFGNVLKSRESVAALRAIIVEAPPHLVPILQCAASGTNRLADVRALLATNIANRAYPVPDVLNLAGGGQHALVVQNALMDTAHENHFEYVRKWVSTGLTAASQVQLRYLVRFQALLEGPGAILAREKADKPYQNDPSKRTGFLMHTFSDGTIMRIHTHWNVTDKKIVSSHVQDASGANGLEINQWPGFANVSAAILVGQNAATPTGGTLSM